ncbi:uncharacterized protein LOC135848227 [Planococcus citri]|uniref:uncharacterized protein LOC135848227 n=1 Tax=Planococcus citri TaxID=170843 RepID=UPI0031F82CF0
MILHVLLILSTKLMELKSEKALIFSPSLNEPQDLCSVPGDELTFTVILACPATSQKEKQFDEKVSLTGHSLFYREFHPKHKLVENIQQDICEKSFEPVMVYDHTRDEYKIGYELYYDDAKVPEFNSCNGTCYHSYQLAQMAKNQTNHELTNQTAPTSDLVIKYEDGHKLKFNFTDGSQTLVFHWVDVLTLKSSGNNKRIVNSLTYTSWIYNLSSTCQYYNPSDENIYSEQNQEIHLKDIFVQPSPSNETNHVNISCGQAYGCLVNAQIGSLMHFLSSAERLASCSHMNMIPVWKTIAEGQLLKVDAYTMALDALFIPYRKILGVSGVLKMRKASNPDESREILLSDCEHRTVIHVPKIIYRIIEYQRVQCGNDVDKSQWVINQHAAVIIIHNDPSLVQISDDQRLCDRQSTLTGGWETIINDDPRTGLTYVCPMTPELNDELGAYEDSITAETFQPLNVDAVPYCNSLTMWDPEDKIFHLNYTTNILENFDEILADARAR